MLTSWLPMNCPLWLSCEAPTWLGLCKDKKIIIIYYESFSSILFFNSIVLWIGFWKSWAGTRPYFRMQKSKSLGIIEKSVSSSLHKFQFIFVNNSNFQISLRGNMYEKFTQSVGWEILQVLRRYLGNKKKSFTIMEDVERVAGHGFCFSCQHLFLFCLNADRKVDQILVSDRQTDGRTVGRNKHIVCLPSSKLCSEFWYSARSLLRFSHKYTKKNWRNLHFLFKNFEWLLKFFNSHCSYQNKKYQYLNYSNYLNYFNISHFILAINNYRKE